MKIEIKIHCECGHEEIVDVLHFSDPVDSYFDIGESFIQSNSIFTMQPNPEGYRGKCTKCNHRFEII